MITGGVKSGKSSFALTCGETGTTERAFVATATGADDDMRAKIARHRAERGERWKTFEEPRNLAGLIPKIGGVFDVVLVDCLTMWLSNLLAKGEAELASERQQLVAVLPTLNTPVILVSNEVGWGIVPANPLARRFRDGATA